MVTPPTVVREMDWIEAHWPKDLPEDLYVCMCVYMCMWFVCVCVSLYVCVCDDYLPDVYEMCVDYE